MINNVNIKKITNNKLFWLDNCSKDVELSSRIRLARNISGFPFTSCCQQNTREQILKLAFTSVQKMIPQQNWLMFEVPQLSNIERQILQERHLVSTELCQSGTGSGVIINEQETISIMVNEEDHLRIQLFNKGKQLEKLCKKTEQIEDKLAKELTFCFRKDLGYLTACPSNVGTGLRASVMLHLPGLILMDNMPQTITAIQQMGFAIRGSLGEGSEATGYLFQISNQSTLGEDEITISKKLKHLVNKIIREEKKARIRLYNNFHNKLYDYIGRAYGTLTNSYLISTNEACHCLSALRLGIVMKIFSAKQNIQINHLMLNIQPGHLQLLAGTKLRSKDRDAYRAKLIRESIC